MITISIVVPIYNTEDYLPDCLNSIYLQVSDSVEIILVDDGSTDSSGELCDEFRNEHGICHIKVIHKVNGGLSEARNIGINEASGMFILFLDSDDMLSCGAISYLDAYVKMCFDMDIFFFDAVVLNETNADHSGKEYNRTQNVKNETMSGIDYFMKWHQEKMIVSSCLCLFRRKYLTDNSFLYTPGVVHEDFSFSFKTIINAEKVLYIPKALYIRRYRNNSITTQAISLKNYMGIQTAYRECLFESNKSFDGYMEYNNAMARFWEFGVHYLEETCKRCGGELRQIEDILNGMIDRITTHESMYSYSEVYALYSICSLMDKGGIEYSYKNKKTLNKLFAKNKKQSITDELNVLLADLRKRLLSTIPLDKEGLNIGIYGAGKHTEYLLREYNKLRRIKANIFYIVSSVPDSTEYKGVPIYDVLNIPIDTDYVLLSSYLHHNELLLCLDSVLPYRKFELIDFYQMEKLPLFL